MDCAEEDSCLKCNKGGNLLVCSENGCPLAVHEECMGCPAGFDDSDRFYCPYCLYKQAVEESHRAMEYALSRKKALLIFMDEKMMGSEKHIEENKKIEDNVRNESKIGEADVKIIRSEDDDDDDKNKLKSNAVFNQHIQLDKEHKINNAEEEKIREEESEASAGSKGQDPSLKLHEEQSISNEEDKRNQEEEHETSAASSGQDPSLKMHEHKICNDEKEQVQEEESEPSSASTGDSLLSLTMQTRAKRGCKRGKPVDRNSEVVSVRSRLHKKLDKNKQTSPIANSPGRSYRRSSSALKAEKQSNELVGVSKSLKKSEQLTVKLATDAFGSGKRKRLLWTVEEEKFLEIGVAKYSKEANINIPWRKILGLGSHVFNITRYSRRP